MGILLNKKTAETHTNIRYVNAKAQVKEIIIVMVIITGLALITSYSAVTTGHAYPVDRYGVCKNMGDREGGIGWDLRFHRDSKKTKIIEEFCNG